MLFESAIFAERRLPGRAARQRTSVLHSGRTGVQERGGRERRMGRRSVLQGIY